MSWRSTLMELRRSSPTRSSDDMASSRFSADLVEEFFRRLADTLEPSGLHHCQIRIGDVPEVRRDLVFRDVIFHLRTTNARPSFGIAELEVQDVGDLRREVLDVDVPVAIVGGAEEQLRVVVQKHEAHVVDGADLVHEFIANAAVQNLQKTTQSLGSAWCERDDHRQLRDLALTAADPAGAFNPCCRFLGPRARPESAYQVLQRGFPNRRRVRVKLPKLLHLLLKVRGLLRSCLPLRLHDHAWPP